MVVGTLVIELFIGSSVTLKDKRRVLRSILDKVKAKFNVSIAEVGNQDAWQRSTLGVACVSNETAHAQSMLSKVTKFIESQGDADIIAVHTEIF